MKANLMHKYLKTFKGLTKEQLHTYFAEVAKEMEKDMNTGSYFTNEETCRRWLLYHDRLRGIYSALTDNR